jgi:hypothetical protein
VRFCKGRMSDDLWPASECVALPMHQDTGDGGNSTYAVARALAAPLLHISTPASMDAAMPDDESGGAWDAPAVPSQNAVSLQLASTRMPTRQDRRRALSVCLSACLEHVESASLAIAAPTPHHPHP